MKLLRGIRKASANVADLVALYGRYPVLGKALVFGSIRVAARVWRTLSMGFTTPTFNLPFHLWRQPLTVGGLPRSSGMCNLSVGQRQTLNLDTSVFVTGYVTGVQGLMVPAGYDIAGILTDPVSYGEDIVEVPGGSGRFYVVLTVVDVGKGFGNEYRLAVIAQLNQAMILFTGNPWAAPAWPVPTP